MKQTNVEISLGRMIGEHFFLEPFVFIIRWMPGAYGVILRMALYKLLFKKTGKNFTVMEGVKFLFPERIRVGSHTMINEYCYFHAKGGISIGDWVRIAPYVKFFTWNHTFEDPDIPIKKQKGSVKEIVVEDDVWIGTNAIILQGIKIGKGSVIAAGALVNKDVPPFSVVGGVPARILKKRVKDYKKDGQ